MPTDNHKIALRIASVILCIVWVVLGLINGWPLWVWLALAVLSLVAPPLIRLALVEFGCGIGGNAPSEPDVAEEPPPAPQPEPPKPRSVPIHDVLLDSSREDYQFLFSCTVFWLPRENTSGRPHTEPGAVAADTILREVTQLVATVRPDDASRAQYRLMSALGTPRTDQTGRVETWAAHISLRLTDEDASRLKRLAEVRKDEEVWEYERNYERNVRTYLGDDVLTSMGSALVWWLAGPRTDEKNRVGDAVEQIPNLWQLTQTATGQDIPLAPGGNFADSEHDGFALGRSYSFDPSTLVSQDATVPCAENGNSYSTADEGVSLEQRAVRFLDDLPEHPERAFLSRQIADHLRSHGYSTAAHTVSTQFDAPLSSPENQDAHATEHTPTVSEASSDDGSATGPANGHDGLASDGPTQHSTRTLTSGDDRDLTNAEHPFES